MDVLCIACQSANSIRELFRRNSYIIYMFIWPHCHFNELFRLACQSVYNLPHTNIHWFLASFSMSSLIQMGSVPTFRIPIHRRHSFTHAATQTLPLQLVICKLCRRLLFLANSRIPESTAERNSKHISIALCVTQSLPKRLIIFVV